MYVRVLLAVAAALRFCPENCGEYTPDGCNACVCDPAGQLERCTRRFCRTPLHPRGHCLRWDNTTDPSPAPTDPPEQSSVPSPDDQRQCPIPNCRVFMPDRCNECYCSPLNRVAWCTSLPCSEPELHSGGLPVPSDSSVPSESLVPSESPVPSNPSVRSEWASSFSPLGLSSLGDSRASDSPVRDSLARDSPLPLKGGVSGDFAAPGGRCVDYRSAPPPGSAPVFPVEDEVDSSSTSTTSAPMPPSTTPVPGSCVDQTSADRCPSRCRGIALLSCQLCGCSAGGEVEWCTPCLQRCANARRVCLDPTGVRAPPPLMRWDHNTMANVTFDITLVLPATTLCQEFHFQCPRVSKGCYSCHCAADTRREHCHVNPDCYHNQLAAASSLTSVSDLLASLLDGGEARCHTPHKKKATPPHRARPQDAPAETKPQAEPQAPSRIQPRPTEPRAEVVGGGWMNRLTYWLCSIPVPTGVCTFMQN